AAATGLFRLKDNVSRPIASEQGLTQTSVFAVFEASDRTWWFGLSGGGIYRYDQKRATQLPVPAVLGLDQVLSIAEEPVGTIWMGTTSGLYRHVDGATTNLYDAVHAPAWQKALADRRGATVPGIADPRVNSLAPDGSGGLWVATDGGLYRGREGEFRVYTTADGLPGSVAKSVLRAKNGDVWVAFPPHGVARLRGSRWTNFLCGDAISPVFPRSVYEDRSGDIWVTTEGGGLNRFHDDRWRTFTVRDGLADDFISGITEDDSGNYWVAIPRGEMRIPQTEFDEMDAGRSVTLRLRVFDRADGLLAAESNQMGSPSAFATRDGRLLFPTDRGVNVVEPALVKNTQLAPRMHIERVMVNGVAADLTRAVAVPPGNNDVEIHYTAISLLTPEKVRFKIRLSPLDSDWIETGGRRDVRYAKLPPGEYAFRAIASTSDGGWNETGAAVAFTVQPFFYRTGWFIGMVVVGGAAIVFGVYRMRAQLARSRLAALEKTIAERTRELRCEVAMRNRVAEALQNSEAFLHSLVENLPASVFRKDKEGRFVFVNDRCAARHDRSREDLLGKSDADLYPAELAKGFRAQEQEVMTTRRRRVEIQSGFNQDGSPAWFHMIKTAVVDGGGAVIGTQGISWDVTEREQALQELKTAKEEAAREHARFKFIFDSLPVGVSLALEKPDGTRTRVINDAHLRICGLTREQADEPGIFHRISHPDDYAQQAALVEQLKAQKIDGFSLEKRYIRPADGQEVWVAFGVQRRHHAGGSFEDLSTVVDITALKRADEANARERARFKFIFESLPVGVSWMLCGKLDTRIVNPAHVQLSGVSMERSCERALYRQNTHPEDRAAQDALHQRLVAGEIDRYALEKRYVHPDGRVCWVALNVGSFRDETSGEVQEITSLVDITERKTAELEREKMHRQLLELSRQAGMAEVATGVLHNVGNVLNSVNVSSTILTDQVKASRIDNIGKLADLLRENEADLGNFIAHDPRGRQVTAFLDTLSTHLRKEQSEMLLELESLRKNIDHIKDIVAMQQSYAKVSGLAEMLPITDLVEDALRMNRGGLEHHGVALVRDFRANPVVTVEKHKVLQILVNLMRNAKHACEESGRGDKCMTVQVSAEPARVKITVSDNGVGIPPENLTRIFAHGFTTRREGHGFGLHSGALAAQELGGALTAYSEGVGRGASFVLELPYRTEGKAA
ncbi:MAG: PAS domain S-box protein, partial [Opitutaceae bacterium]